MLTRVSLLDRRVGAFGKFGCSRIGDEIRACRLCGAMACGLVSGIIAGSRHNGSICTGVLQGKL